MDNSNETSFESTNPKVGVYSSIKAVVVSIIVGFAKVSALPVISFLMIAFIVGALDSVGADERTTMLGATLTMFSLSLLNAFLFWRSGKRRTAILGGGLWVAISLLYVLVVLAFWHG